MKMFLKKLYFWVLNGVVKSILGPGSFCYTCAWVVMHILKYMYDPTTISWLYRSWYKAVPLDMNFYNLIYIHVSLGLQVYTIQTYCSPILVSRGRSSFHRISSSEYYLKWLARQLALCMVLLLVIIHSNKMIPLLCHESLYKGSAENETENMCRELYRWEINP